ncbi:MAG: Gfo/Idh/MocA family oxidoreductase [Chloroflexi bacterium]|nr:Gfo/Idh/MocA family oxidoreductase [Chloroflexota bacterium]
MAAELQAIFVGVGGRGRNHLDAWIDHPRLGVAGLVDINPQYLEDARKAAALPPTGCFSTLADALATLNADVVVVVTHAQTHARFIRAALQAGKHVVVEKPMTCDLAEAEELVRLADRAGRKLMVTQQIRYLPVERTIRRLLAEEAYGRPGFGHYVNYKVRGLAYPQSDHMQLWQMSIHELDALLAMIDRPVARVQAREFQPSWGNWPSESTIAAILEFAGGPTISYVSSSDSRGWGLEFRLECERGALIQRAKRVGGEGTLALATRDGEQAIHLDSGVDNKRATRAMADLFASYVLDGIEPEVSGARNLVTLRLCDAVIRSAQTGRVVDLGDG